MKEHRIICEKELLDETANCNCFKCAKPTIGHTMGNHSDTFGGAGDDEPCHCDMPNKVSILGQEYEVDKASFTDIISSHGAGEQSTS